VKPILPLFFSFSAVVATSWSVPLPAVSLATRPAGICVEHSTQRGLLYQMETSGDLLTWEPSGPMHYGAGSDFSAVVYVLPPPPNDPNPPPPWDAPARWLSFFVTPVSTTQTVVGFFSGGRFIRALLTSSNFLSPNFRPHVAIRQDEGTPANPFDDVVVDCDFMLFGSSRDLLLLPRSDENFLGMTTQQKADLQRLIAARAALIAENTAANNNPIPVGPPVLPGPHRHFRLKVTTIDSDADGINDYDEFIVGTNPYANPALNPPGTGGTAANPSGLTWKPFWKRSPQTITIQQEWRRADIAIAESNPAFGSGAVTMTRVGSVQNYAMAAPRSTGLSAPAPLRDQVRVNPKGELTLAWASPTPVMLEPVGANPSWETWQPAANLPLYSSYRCEQTLDVQLIQVEKWGWRIKGEERIFRITCPNSPTEDIVRHFLLVKRSRKWVGNAMPDWTYEPTTIQTLTIPKGAVPQGTDTVVASESLTLLLPFPQAEVGTPEEYTAKTTEKEQIFLPIEVLVPERQPSGTLLAKAAGERRLIPAPELRIAKLFPGLDAAGASYSPIPEAPPNEIVPKEDPDSFVIRVHDTLDVWKNPATPTAKPGIRVTTSTPAPYDATHSDTKSNPSQNQMDAANTGMVPGWLATKAMLLVSNLNDNNQAIAGASAGSRNDPTRIVLPGGSVTVTFPGWQRTTSAPPSGAAVSFDIPVPIAAKATLDMKIFADALQLSPAPNLFADHLKTVNEHFAQTGIQFTKRPTVPPNAFNAVATNSSIASFYLTNVRPSPLAPQVRELGLLAGRATANGTAPNQTYTRNDGFLGVLFCANQPGNLTNAGLALMTVVTDLEDRAFAGNLFLNFNANLGTTGYDSATTAHEVGHLLSNKGHFGGIASSPANYQSSATAFEKGLNLMTEGPWTVTPQTPPVWPATHQRFSEEQEHFMFTNGAAWLRNP
jgi:hypothetical protein